MIASNRKMAQNDVRDDAPAVGAGRLPPNERRLLSFGELLTQAAGGLLSLAGGSGMGTYDAEPNRPDQVDTMKEPT